MKNKKDQGTISAGKRLRRLDNKMQYGKLDWILEKKKGTLVGQVAKCEYSLVSIVLMLNFLFR